MTRHFMTGAVMAAGLIGLPLTAAAQNAPAAPPAQPTQSAPPAAQAAAPAAPTQFSDAQLNNFAEASVQIDAIKQRTQSNGATPESQAQMRAALQQHQLSAADYNNIVAAMQADSALAQRVATLRAQAGAGAAVTH